MIHAFYVFMMLWFIVEIRNIFTKDIKLEYVSYFLLIVCVITCCLSSKGIWGVLINISVWVWNFYTSHARYKGWKKNLYN